MQILLILKQLLHILKVTLHILKLARQDFTHTNARRPLSPGISIIHIYEDSSLHREDFLPLKVGGCGLGGMDLCHRAGQHILVDEEKICILANADAAALVLDEHLLGAA